MSKLPRFSVRPIFPSVFFSKFGKDPFIKIITGYIYNTPINLNIDDIDSFDGLGYILDVYHIFEFEGGTESQLLIELPPDFKLINCNCNSFNSRQCTTCYLEDSVTGKFSCYYCNRDHDWIYGCDQQECTICLGYTRPLYWKLYTTKLCPKCLIKEGKSEDIAYIYINSKIYDFNLYEWIPVRILNEIVTVQNRNSESKWYNRIMIIGYDYDRDIITFKLVNKNVLITKNFYRDYMIYEVLNCLSDDLIYLIIEYLPRAVDIKFNKCDKSVFLVPGFD